MADKQDYNRHNREYDEEQQKQHFQSWETFWGRPGYGAPREVLRPNNYMMMIVNILMTKSKIWPQLHLLGQAWLWGSWRGKVGQV